MSHHPPLHPDESEPIALNPLLRGVDLAIDRLIRRNCFTGRTLDILDELREELLAVSSDTRPQGNPEMTFDDLRKIAEAATEGPWAPWPDQDGSPHMNGLLMVGNADAVIPEGETWIEGVDINPIAHVLTPEDREFIATFDPERVLQLLDENEQLRKLVADYAREYPLECNKRVKAETRLAAVEKLHQKRYYTARMTATCTKCETPWPCDDIKAARGE